MRFESNIWLDHSPSNAPDFQIEDYARTYPFAYGPQEMPDLGPRHGAPIPRRRRHRRPLGAPLPAHRPAHRHRHAADDAHVRLQGELHLRAPLRARHAAAGPHAQARPRQLPRPGSADDRGAALPRASRPASSRATCTCPAATATGRATAAAARRTPGARSICPAPAGSSSTPPTPSSATAIWCAWPWRAIRARPSRCRAPISARPPTFEEMTVEVKVRSETAAAEPVPATVQASLPVQRELPSHP